MGCVSAVEILSIFIKVYIFQLLKREWCRHRAGRHGYVPAVTRRARPGDRPHHRPASARVMRAIRARRRSVSCSRYAAPAGHRDGRSMMPTLPSPPSGRRAGRRGIAERTDPLGATSNFARSCSIRSCSADGVLLRGPHGGQCADGSACAALCSSMCAARASARPAIADDENAGNASRCAAVSSCCATHAICFCASGRVMSSSTAI